MGLKVEENEMSGTRSSKIVINLPLPQQFALKAVKLPSFGRKTRHVWHPN